MLRQSLELAVGSESQAHEIHAELSETFGERLSSALDEAFGAACAEDETLRIDSIELDLGVLSRERLPELLAQRARDHLAEILGSGSQGDPRVPGDTSPVRRLSAPEVALERLATFLATGALVARDRRATRDELEAELVRIVEAAPQALVTQLRALPRAASARRLARQFSPGIALRIAALLGGIAVPEIEALIGEWRSALALARRPDNAAGREASVGSSRESAVESVLELLLEFPDLSRALRALADHLVDRRSAREGVATRAAIEAPRDDVASSLPASSRIRQAIEHAERSRGLDRRRRASRAGTETSAGELESRPAIEPVGPAEPGAGKPARPQARAVERKEEEKDSTALNLPPGVEGALVPSEKVKPADGFSQGRSSPFSGAPDRRRSPEGEDGENAPRFSPAQDAFRVDNAGLVILWPFLSDFFGALGLVANRRFVSDPARSRAVLLTAHLCDGGEQWDEHELLLGKLLCGHPPFDPIDTRIEVSEAEREESRALLESAIGHWSVLKTTSSDGLRGAFLRRQGTLAPQEQGWKLRVARAAHDVFLDKLPWGFGLVLLPWMEQPLYVEW